MAVTALAEPSATVVVINRNVPESASLGRYYASKRGIPERNLCTLDLPKGEVMSRRDFERRLRDPLLEFLRAANLITQEERPADQVQSHQTEWATTASSVRFLVSMYGVPLRIADTKFDLVAKLATHLGKPEYKNTASVDAEIVLLLYPGYDISGAQPNPLFGRRSLQGLAVPQHQYLVAARLDGPAPATVRAMIDGAVEAERYGLQGRAYIDSSTHQDAYALGDLWLNEAAERFRREGYETVLDGQRGMWGNAYPMEDAALYMGWYTEHVVGPFTRPGFRFRPGAVAYHLHSASALTLRETARQWAGPLLNLGAAATMGAVHEPYLAFTPHLDVFADRLCAGRPFGEAAYMALSHVSWQITVVGDPLYTPFKLSLDEQIEQLSEEARPELEWALVRKVNLMIREGRFEPAVQLCTDMIDELGSLVLREKLGDLFALNERMDDAVTQYAVVVHEAQTAATAVRVGRHLIEILRKQGRIERAEKFEEDIRQRWKGDMLLAWLTVGAE